MFRIGSKPPSTGRRAGLELGGGPLIACVALALVPVAAGAQAVADGPAPPRASSLGLGATLEASAIDVRSRANGNNGTELLLRASPSLVMAHRGGQVQGSLAYSGALTQRRGIDDREDTDYANTLSANYVIEAIKDRGFVDARASITQQSVLAVGAGGAGSAGGSQPAGNRTEVATVSVSPYVRGSFGGAVDYEVRAAGTASESSAASTADSKSALASFSLRSPARAAVLGWGLGGSRQVVKFSTASSATTTDRVLAELVLQPDIDWRLSANGGQERTDVIGARRLAYDNYGIEVRFTPSPRTTISARGEERYFGRGHRVGIEHRLQRSSLRYVDSRDVTGGADTLAQGAAVTLYDYLSAQYAAQIPNEVERDQFVQALILSQGRSRDDVLVGGVFVNGGITVQRRRELVWAWSGPRLTMSASGYVLDSQRADTGGFNPVARNDNVAQSGYAGSVGWRLTPLTSINATGSRSMSQDTVSLQRSDLKSASLGLTSRLGQRTSAALAARYSVLNGTVDSYRETSLSGSLSLRF